MSSLQLTRRSQALISHWRVLSALTLWESGGLAEHNLFLGVLIRLAQPAVMIFATVCMSWLISRQPPYGRSMLLWSVTGVGPIFLFVHIAMRAGRARRLALPFVTDLDIFLVHVFLEFLYGSASMVLLLAVMYLTGTTEAYPANFGLYLAGWFATAGLAIGISLISRIMWRLYLVWRVGFPALNRAWLHMSGVYFVVDYLPPDLSYWLSFNPLVHAVTLFRLAFYPMFPTYTYSLSYLMCWVFGTMALGLGMEVYLGDRLKSR